MLWRIKIQVLKGNHNASSNILMWTLTHRGADLDSKDNNYCTPTHIAAMYQFTDAYHCLMEYIPVDLHASVIFTAFDVKHNREIILEV